MNFGAVLLRNFDGINPSNFDGLEAFDVDRVSWSDIEEFFADPVKACEVVNKISDYVESDAGKVDVNIWKFVRIFNRLSRDESYNGVRSRQLREAVSNLKTKLESLPADSSPSLRPVEMPVMSVADDELIMPPSIPHRVASELSRVEARGDIASLGGTGGSDSNIVTPAPSPETLGSTPIIEPEVQRRR